MLALTDLGIDHAVVITDHPLTGSDIAMLGGTQSILAGENQAA